MEAQLCVGQEVAIVGGGNSAGQAAVFLASMARRVHMLVRGSGLAETMSRYLIRRIEENPAIVLRTHTEIVALDGDGRLERVRWRDDRTGGIESHDIGHVFMMTGAVPNTGWLDSCIVLDEKGFVKTGRDRSTEELAKAAGRWLDIRICSKPAGPASSPSEMYAAATSSASRLPSAKGQLPSRSSTRCLGSNHRVTRPMSSDWASR
jgi:hypothetical protein